jgi:hypothetical protein
MWIFYIYENIAPVFDAGPCNKGRHDNQAPDQGLFDQAGYVLHQPVCLSCRVQTRTASTTVSKMLPSTVRPSKPSFKFPSINIAPSLRVNTYVFILELAHQGLTMLQLVGSSHNTDYHLSVNLNASEGHIQRSETGSSFVKFTLITRACHGDCKSQIPDDLDECIDLTVDKANSVSATQVNSGTDFQSLLPCSCSSTSSLNIVPVCCTCPHLMHAEINAVTGPSRSHCDSSPAFALESPTYPQSSATTICTSGVTRQHKRVSDILLQIITTFTYVIQISCELWLLFDCLCQL